MSSKLLEIHVSQNLAKLGGGCTAKYKRRGRKDGISGLTGQVELHDHNVYRGPVYAVTREKETGASCAGSVIARSDHERGCIHRLCYLH